MSSDDTKDQPSQAPQYAEEILCANWNPLALMLAKPLANAQQSLPDGIDVEAFIARFYLRRQA